MLINPTLTRTQIEAKIAILETKVDEMAEVGDSISSAGAQVDYNNRYNHYKNQLEQLYSMLTNAIARGE